MGSLPELRHSVPLTHSNRVTGAFGVDYAGGPTEPQGMGSFCRALPCPETDQQILHQPTSASTERISGDANMQPLRGQSQNSASLRPVVSSLLNRREATPITNLPLATCRYFLPPAIYHLRPDSAKRLTPDSRKHTVFGFFFCFIQLFVIQYSIFIHQSRETGSTCFTFPVPAAEGPGQAASSPA